MPLLGGMTCLSEGMLGSPMAACGTWQVERRMDFKLSLPPWVHTYAGPQIAALLLPPEKSPFYHC